MARMVPQAPVVLPAQRTPEVALAPRWKVLLVDDDVTTVEFVIWLLQVLFHKPATEAVRLTAEVDQTGAALICVTSRERAELYLEQVHSLARPRGYPLRAVMEPA
jgi:ATP-dependent Clp protease adaptor protein ClpS